MSGSFPTNNYQTTTYAILDLCLHPEYTAVLREEVSHGLRDGGLKNAEKLPLLDSFLKESIRHSNSDAGSCFLASVSREPYLTKQTSFKSPVVARPSSHTHSKTGQRSTKEIGFAFHKRQ